MMNGPMPTWISNQVKASDVELDYIFIGSCTNARLSDLQLAARFVEGRKNCPNLTAIVVPGSRPVKRQRKKMGSDKIFLDATPNGVIRMLYVSQG